MDEATKKNYIQVTHPLKDDERAKVWEKMLCEKGYEVYLEETPDGVIVWRKKLEGENVT
ncbi:hypothetical protein ACFL35_09350 [Candidatus Riflebacteria bacterium]